MSAIIKNPLPKDLKELNENFKDIAIQSIVKEQIAGIAQLATTAVLADVISKINEILTALKD